MRAEGALPLEARQDFALRHSVSVLECHASTDEVEAHPASAGRDKSHVLKGIPALDHDDDGVGSTRVQGRHAVVAGARTANRRSDDRWRIQLRRRGDLDGGRTAGWVLDGTTVDRKVERDGWAR